MGFEGALGWGKTKVGRSGVMAGESCQIHLVLNVLLWLKQCRRRVVQHAPAAGKVVQLVGASHDLDHACQPQGHLPQTEGPRGLWLLCQNDDKGSWHGL